MVPNDPHDDDPHGEGSLDPRNEQAHQPNKLSDQQYGVSQSVDWRAMLRRELTEEMLDRLRVFARYLLRGFGGGKLRPGDIARADDLAVSSASDTWNGHATWNPERKLERHLQNVIVRRLWDDWRSASRHREESIDTHAHDERSTVRDEMERAMEDHVPDPESAAKAAESWAELEQCATADPELAVYIDARAEDLAGADLEAATGLSTETIRRVRRRLDKIGQQLSYRIRPRRRK
jgi:DNA-directed RNA polymerase specialized sigma24 family protein